MGEISACVFGAHYPMEFVDYLLLCILAAGVILCILIVLGVITGVVRGNW